jgi:hypothetical protein
MLGYSLGVGGRFYFRGGPLDDLLSEGKRSLPVEQIVDGLSVTKLDSPRGQFSDIAQRGRQRPSTGVQPLCEVPQIMRPWELVAARREDRLDGLLGSLLRMEADYGVGDVMVFGELRNCVAILDGLAQHRNGWS